MERRRYPADWEAISLRIRERAQGACEWCGAKAGDPIHGRPGTRVVLTVHHLGAPKPDGTPGDPHDKLDCRDENLIALCQGCHLMADLPGHIARAKLTRQRKKEQAQIAAGQLALIEDQ
jgi:hypothetical protein